MIAKKSKHFGAIQRSPSCLERPKLKLLIKSSNFVKVDL